MTNKIKYDVLSPDGFSIHPTDVYDSHDAAVGAFNEWKKRYEQQGYYSSSRNGRIALDDLEGYCRFITIDLDDEERPRIIPYTSEQLSYHLYNNFYPGYSDDAIAKIIETCEKVNSGEWSIHDCIEGTDVLVWEMLDDMRIEYEEYPGQHS